MARVLLAACITFLLPFARHNASNWPASKTTTTRLVDAQSSTYHIVINWQTLFFRTLMSVYLRNYIIVWGSGGPEGDTRQWGGSTHGLQIDFGHDGPLGCMGLHGSAWVRLTTDPRTSLFQICNLSSWVSPDWMKWDAHNLYIQCLLVQNSRSLPI